MRNHITIESKIGYLNPKTGKYSWATVTGITANEIHLKKHQSVGKYSQVINRWTEKTKDVISWLKTPSEDWKDGRPLLKFKGNNIL